MKKTLSKVTRLEWKCTNKVHRPSRSDFRIERAWPLPLPFYKYLLIYTGRHWNWIDRLLLNDDQISAIISSETTQVYVLTQGGVYAGFCELNTKAHPVWEVVYFGVLPEFSQQGLGHQMMLHIQHLASSRKAEKITLHTCDLDSPRAIPFYKKHGFAECEHEYKEQMVAEPHEADYFYKSKLW